MGRLSPMQRVQVIAIYTDLHDLKDLNKCKKVAQIANERKIEISLLIYSYFNNSTKYKIYCHRNLNYFK